MPSTSSDDFIQHAFERALLKPELREIASIFKPAGCSPWLEVEPQPDVRLILEQDARLNDVGAKNVRQVALLAFSILQQCENWTGSTTIAFPARKP